MSATAYVAVRINTETGTIDQVGILSEFPPTENRGRRWFKRMTVQGLTFAHARDLAITYISGDPELRAMFERLSHDHDLNPHAPRLPEVLVAESAPPPAGTSRYFRHRRGDR